MVLSGRKNAKYYCRSLHLDTQFNCRTEGILQADLHEMIVTLIRTYAAYAVSMENLLLLQGAYAGEKTAGMQRCKLYFSNNMKI